MDIEIKEDERIDDLQCNGAKIIQNKNGFCFGIDSVILANYIKNINSKNLIVDLGTGTGILGILLCAKGFSGKILGVELQSDVAQMAQKSILLNNMEKNFSIINEDINNIIPKKLINKNTVDVIITNPPYKNFNDGITNINEKKLISRHETTATLEDFISVSSGLLKDNGTLYMVHKPERLVDIIYFLRLYKIESKEIQFVFSNKNKDASLVLIKAIKCANKFLKIDKPLYIYNTDGSYSNDIEQIYKNKLN